MITTNDLIDAFAAQREYHQDADEGFDTMKIVCANRRFAAIV